MTPNPTSRHSRTSSWSSTASDGLLPSPKMAAHPSVVPLLPEGPHTGSGSTTVSTTSSPRDGPLKDLRSPGGKKKIQSSLYKTELCRTYEDNGSCRYGTRCQFAHGEEELRPVARHPRYKSEICKAFHTTGMCSYGQRCRFIHATSTEASPASPRAMPPPPAPVAAVPKFNTPEPAFLKTAQSNASSSPRRLPFFRALAETEVAPAVFTAIGPVAFDPLEATSPVQQRYSMATKVDQPVFRSGPMVMSTHNRSNSVGSTTSLMSLESGTATWSQF